MRRPGQQVGRLRCQGECEVKRVVSRILAAAATAAAAAAAMLLSSCASESIAPPRPDVISLGRNAAGEPCSATRDWNDRGAPDVFATSYSITCRNVAASRSLGAVRVVADTPAGLAPIDKALDCGPDVAVTLASGQARARRCHDKLLAIEAVRIDMPMGRSRLIADATPALVGPLEEAVAIVSGAKSPSKDSGRATKATIDVADLPAAPAIAAATQSDAAAFDPAEALNEGISLNHKGLHVEASRVLNDALSRLPPGTNPATRAELLLEAGLADSNIRFADTAKEHFDEADAIMASSPDANTEFLHRKRDAYHALDLLNRRQFPAALTALDKLVSGEIAADQPLMDPAVVRELNQTGGHSRDASNAIAMPDTAGLSQLVLDAQANWARSVALLALGDDAGAAIALDAASKAYAPLQNERIDQAQVLWLGARIERQRGRLAARRKDWPVALASFDRALDDLQRGAVATAGTGNEPAVAETRLERASIFAASGASHDAIRNAYAAAVDGLIASDSAAGTLPSYIDGYFDLLVAEAKDGARPDTYDRFFRAMQASGEPAVARQLSQLQTVVTSDPALGSKVRDRAELEREITRLRYAIAGADQPATGAATAGPAVGAADGPSVAELEQQRQAAESKLLAIDGELSADPRYRTVDDRPATIEEVRKALRPGEGYWKITELNRRAYGLFVTANDTFIYTIADSEKAVHDINQLGTDIRSSIDGELAQGKLVPFDDAKAYVLFRLLSGPAMNAILKAKALVVDPAGPLQNLPASVLVTSYDANFKRPSPFDFSQTHFLAETATISTALSPRSFLVARALPPSDAPHAFLGLGEHQPPTDTANSSRDISVGFGCSVPFSRLSALSHQLIPIDKSELEIAASALGVPNSPMITDAAFSDTAIEARTDLADYDVLHFATHGLEEGQWGCSKSPPALVTSFGDQNSDGLLGFSEIAKLRLNANLVVLSACDTASGVKNEALARASGQEEAGSTLEGLVRAFLTANTRAVLATYWPVSAEHETSDFIRTFYSSARRETIGGALQDAQRELMKQPDFSHPFYWAPYFVVGDSTKMMLSRPVQTPQVAVR
jgi:CHAT domain-containing protein/tetratricopeptide (TPR) repeat protein